jgi:alcohol dehydrogenase (NADP+)
MKIFNTKAYGATGTPLIGKILEPMMVKRNEPKANEVLIEILYCGVCHSDIHQINNDWKNTLYPCIPGHEIVGRISQTGHKVAKFKRGDLVGVGCMINSCGKCHSCREGEEQFCGGPVGATMTYNGYFEPDGSGFNTFGGFSSHIVANENFVVSIPKKLNVSHAAPILCAGVTTYSPLKHWNVKAGDKVGIVGIGGLGHMAVMIAKAMGAEVTAITTMPEKRSAARKLGAADVLISDNKDAMKARERSFDFMLCTIPESFDVNHYIPLLKARGTLVTVGLLGPYKAPTYNMEVAKLGRSVCGSLIGGIAETQEVLNFCAKHSILPHVEMIDIQNVNDAFEKIKDKEVRFRYVIDMQSLKQP